MGLITRQVLQFLVDRGFTDGARLVRASKTRASSRNSYHP